MTIPEQQGSFLKFCQLLGGRSVTEFNYRYADADNACIFVGVRLTRGHAERREIIDELNADGYQVVDLSDDDGQTSRAVHGGWASVEAAARTAVQL